MTSHESRILIDLVLCGGATPEQRDRFDGLVLGDAGFARDVARHAAMTCELYERFAGAVEALTMPRPTPPAVPARSQWISPALRVAAAVAIVATLLTVYLAAADRSPASAQPVGDEAPVATLTFADAEVIGDEPIMTGVSFRPQTIRVQQGEAELILTSGTQLNVAGGSELRVRSPMNVSMTRGSAVFFCPPAAKGFTVDLVGGARIVDLGTRFSVDTDAAGRSFIHVHEGMVDVISPGGGEAATLRMVAGQSARCETATGHPTLITPPAATVDIDDSRAWIVRHAGSVDPAVEGWTRVSTRSGTTIGPVEAHGDTNAEAWLIDDHDRLHPNAGRGSQTGRAYYRFDLPGSAGQSVLSRRWVLEAIVAVDAGEPSAPNQSRTIGLISPDGPDGGREFRLDLGTTADGHLIVQNRDGELRYVSGRGGYHRLSLVYDPASRAASLYVDAMPIPEFVGDAGSPSPNRREFADAATVRFGSTTTQASGAALYRFVGLAILEPGQNPLPERRDATGEDR